MNDDATGGEQATITCTTCWTEQPSAEFRRRYAGSEKRHRECRQCYNSASRKRCAAKRQKLVREVAKQVNARRMDYRAVIVLVNKMRERFGGWDQFASEWCDTFQTARKAKKHDLVGQRTLATWRWFTTR